MPVTKGDDGRWYCRANNGKETTRLTRSEAREWVREQNLCHEAERKPPEDKPEPEPPEIKEIKTLTGDKLFLSIERLLLEGHDLEGVNTNPRDVWDRKGNLIRLSYKPDRNASDVTLSGRLFIAGTPFTNPFKAIYAFVLHLRRMGVTEIRRVKRK